MSVILICWFLLAILCGLAMQARGYSLLLGLLASLLLSPLLALILVLILPRREQNAGPASVLPPSV